MQSYVQKMQRNRLSCIRRESVLLRRTTIRPFGKFRTAKIVTQALLLVQAYVQKMWRNRLSYRKLQSYKCCSDGQQSALLVNSYIAKTVTSVTPFCAGIRTKDAAQSAFVIKVSKLQVLLRYDNDSLFR